MSRKGVDSGLAVVDLVVDSVDSFFDFFSFLLVVGAVASDSDSLDLDSDSLDLDFLFLDFSFFSFFCFFEGGASSTKGFDGILLSCSASSWDRFFDLVLEGFDSDILWF